MKATDFGREHFANGRNFLQTDFDGYIQASDNFAKTLYTKYLPCMAGGILISFLFSGGIGGFAGNIMAVLCIFAGLIAGGAFNMRASKAVKEYAARLGITNADVAAAKQHIKNGTVAWIANDTACKGADAEVIAAEVSGQAEGGYPVEVPVETQTAEVQPIESLRKNPLRAAWAAGLMAAAWLLLLVFQSIFGPNTRFNADALFLCVAALVGTAAYLLAHPGLKLKLTGAGAGVIATVMGAFNVALLRNPRLYMQRVGLGEMFSLRNMLFFRAFGGVFFTVALSLAVAWLISTLIKTGGDKRRVRLAALGAAGVYLLCSLTRSALNIRGVIIPDFASLFSTFSGSFFDAACVFLVCMAAYALCNMPSANVKLRGLGLVWAWLATAGMVVSLIAVISAGTSHGAVITYTAQFILAISGLAGYILLLCKRRVGLYVILLGAGVMLGAQMNAALAGVFYRANQYIFLLISNVLGALNPLFAYLAVRAGTNQIRVASVPAMQVESNVSRFQRIAAILCLGAGGIGILFPIVTMLNGAEFVGGMAVYMVISTAVAGLGAFLLAQQHSVARAYGKGMRIFGGISFALGMALLLISTIGIVANISM